MTVAVNEIKRYNNKKREKYNEKGVLTINNLYVFFIYFYDVRMHW